VTLCDYFFRRLDRTSACDRRTDRQTDGQTDGRTKGYGIYHASICITHPPVVLNETNTTHQNTRPKEQTG